jgi:hypothetical protein
VCVLAGESFEKCKVCSSICRNNIKVNMPRMFGLVGVFTEAPIGAADVVMVEEAGVAVLIEAIVGAKENKDC